MKGDIELELLRYNSRADYTDGLLFVDGVFEAHTMEDEYRTKKVWGETRIPEGTYEIELRTEGNFHSRYLKKFGNKFHKGMLWLKDVPNFEYILIHIGNTDDDTAGCILVGRTAYKNKGFTGNSTIAYKELYQKVSTAILKGKRAYIKIETIA